VGVVCIAMTVAVCSRGHSHAQESERVRAVEGRARLSEKRILNACTRAVDHGFVEQCFSVRSQCSKVPVAARHTEVRVVRVTG
jgi:hypothetical protein